MARVNPVNRSEEDFMKTNRHGQWRAEQAWGSSLVALLLALFAERGRVGA
jgi:hypothetical protein